jgi:thiol-disulfide isomerase/thioredoxin
MTTGKQSGRGKRWAVAAVLMVAISACGETERPPAADSTGSAGSSDGQPEPTRYSAKKLGSQETFSLDEVQGQPVLLTSWATWCTVCRYEFPRLEELWQDYRDRGLVVVGVNVNVGGGDDGLVAFIEKKKLTFVQVRDGNNRFQATFHTSVTPESVLMDRKGLVQDHWVGSLDVEAAETIAAIERAIEGGP